MATDELTLLERVLFRIGSAESDEQLQNAVSKFLPPVLLKLSSQQEGVRKKVMELLIHINKRVKSRPLVQLPVEALLLQYQDPTASSFVTNFTIIYIKMGYPRLPTSKQAELAPCVLNALEGKPQSHQDSLLLLLMPVLGNVSVPADPQERSSILGLNERPHVAKLLSQFILDLLLLPYGVSPRTDQPTGTSLPTPAGMSEASFRRVTADAVLSAEQLEQMKLGLVKFLSSGVMPDADVLVHLVVAAADTRFSVANAADMQLKKVVGTLDWSSPGLLSPLYDLYLGTPVVSNKPCPQEHRRRPASTRIRLKLLPFFSRARGPALIFPSCIQVFFESLYGTEFTNARLKAMALQFSMVVITGSSLTRLTPVAAVFLSGLLKVIKEEESSLKALAYSAVGKLAVRVPSLVNKDLCLLQNFFDALSKEDQETRLSVREALLCMIDAFKLEQDQNADSVTGKDVDSRQVMLQALLSGQVESSESSARYLAVRYTATVFPARHVPSRYLLLLASGDSKEEVSSEALRALYGSSNKDKCSEDSLVLPAFPVVCHYLSERANIRLQNPATRYTTTGHVLPFPPHIHTAMLEYLRLCLWHSAGLPTSSVAMQQHPCEHTPALRQYLLSVEDKESIDLYLALVEQLLLLGQAAVPVLCLLEVVGCIPQLLAVRYPSRLPLIKGFFSSSKDNMRPMCAQLYGVIVAHGMDDEQFEDSITNLLQGISNKSIELQQGVVLAVAYSLNRKMCHSQHIGNLTTSPLYEQYVHTILDLLGHQNHVLVSTACTAFQLLASRASLPLTETSSLDLVQRLQAITNNSKVNSKAREQAALALGCLCLTHAFPHTRLIIEGFLTLSKEVRDVDVHLTIGEALVCCVQGSSSPRCRDEWTVSESEWLATQSQLSSATLDEHLVWLLEQLLSLVPEPRPSSRQATCMWLLALLRHCGQRTPVTSRLDSLQHAFMDLLADTNELVQDAASKGLALVYDSSGEECRSRLVTQLLEQLSSGRRQVTRVSNDTRLFEEGALGQSPTGGNLSTYKELCDLASDLNQPDLIYKFMHLANNNAIWNSKKGAAFGFSTIVAQSGQQLTTHLPKIVPRLYRYRFDPTPQIQNSMSSIWHALISDTHKTVDKYHAEILTDLVDNLTSSQWRVRYSACSAVSDFLRCGPNRSLYDSLPLLPQLWTQLFRVMDDVHQGVRTAATATTKDLAKLTLRCCDVGTGKAGENLLRAILPVLLDSGICNTVQEVRTLSLQLVSQLVGTAGSLLQPHLALLIPALLEAAGELEPRAFSYISTRLGADQGAQEALDQARAAAATSHHTTDTVAKCVQYIDANTLPQLVPRLLELMKGSVALGTRVASAHLLVLLTYHLRQELQPYAGKLLAVLVSGLTDRNAAIRKHFASTIGYLTPIAKQSSLEKLFTKLRTSYFDKEDESFHSACAYTMQSILQRNPNILKDHADVIYSLVFLAMHAASTPDGGGSVEVWQEVWQDAAPSTELTLRTNLHSICDMLTTSLQCSSWTTKAQAARAAGTLADKVGSHLSEAEVRVLVGALLAALVGRTWAGKDSLLRALESFVTSCRSVLKQESCTALVSSIVQALLRECNKQDPTYKRTALRVLGSVLSTLDVDCFDQVYTLVQDTLSSQDGSTSHQSEEKDDIEGAVNARENRILLTEVAYETLGKAWPSSRDTQERHRERLLDQCCSHLASSTRPVQVAVVAALHSLVSKLVLLQTAPNSATDRIALSRTLDQLVNALRYALGVNKHLRLRKEALNVLFLLGNKLKDAGLEAELRALTSSFEQTLEEVSKDTSPEVKTRLSDIRQLFKS